MTLLQSVILGIVQGLTEFLPVSSTAHLTIAAQLMGIIDPSRPEAWTEYMAVIQLGTLAAVLIYFYKDIYGMTTEWIRDSLIARKSLREQSLNSRLAWMVGIATIPAVVIGYKFKSFISGTFTKSLFVIACTLILLAIALWLSERFAKYTKTLSDVSFKEAVIIGFAQCLALIPGCSRSGSTLMGGFFAGLNREAAVRFSFLLSIPIILGSGLHELKDALPSLSSDGITTLLVGTGVSAVVGYATIAFLLKYLRTHSTTVFIVYRIVLGVTLLVALQMGWVV